MRAPTWRVCVVLVFSRCVCVLQILPLRSLWACHPSPSFPPSDSLGRGGGRSGSVTLSLRSPRTPGERPGRRNRLGASLVRGRDLCPPRSFPSSLLEAATPAAIVSRRGGMLGSSCPLVQLAAGSVPWAPPLAAICRPDHLGRSSRRLALLVLYGMDGCCGKGRGGKGRCCPAGIVWVGSSRKRVWSGSARKGHRPRWVHTHEGIDGGSACAEGIVWGGSPQAPDKTDAPLSCFCRAPLP